MPGTGVRQRLHEAGPLLGENKQQQQQQQCKRQADGKGELVRLLERQAQVRLRRQLLAKELKRAVAEERRLAARYERLVRESRAAAEEVEGTPAVV